MLNISMKQQRQFLFRIIDNEKQVKEYIYPKTTLANEVIIMFLLMHCITLEVTETADDRNVWEVDTERHGWVCMSLSHWDKWGHRRGLISSSLVFTPWRKRRRWLWGCVSTLIVNETSPCSFIYKWQREGREEGVCAYLWRGSDAVSVWKKRQSNCRWARWQMRKREREAQGICHKSSACLLLNNDRRGRSGRGGGCAEGQWWQITDLEGNWAPSMQREWQGGRQQ